MADDRMALNALIEQASDRELLAAMLGFVAEKPMALDVEALCNARVHERTGERINHRNGYRDRAWQMRAGTLAIEVPKLRKGSCFPEVLEPRRGPRRRDAYHRTNGVTPRWAARTHPEGPGAFCRRLRCAPLVVRGPRHDTRLTGDKSRFGETDQ